MTLPEHVLQQVVRPARELLDAARDDRRDLGLQPGDPGAQARVALGQLLPEALQLLGPQERLQRGSTRGRARTAGRGGRARCSTGTRITTVVKQDEERGGEGGAARRGRRRGASGAGASRSATQAATAKTRRNGWKTQNARSEDDGEGEQERGEEVAAPSLGHGTATRGSRRPAARSGPSRRDGAGSVARARRRPRATPATRPSVKRPARNSSRIPSTTAAQKPSPQRAWASRSPMTAIDWLSGATKRRTPLRSAVVRHAQPLEDEGGLGAGVGHLALGHVHADLAPRAGLRLADRGHDPLVVEGRHERVGLHALPLTSCSRRRRRRRSPRPRRSRRRRRRHRPSRRHPRRPRCSRRPSGRCRAASRGARRSGPRGRCATPGAASQRNRTTKRTMIRIATSGTPCACRRRGLVLAARRRQDAVDAGLEAARPVAGAEARAHLVVEDPRRELVGQGPLEPVAGLDPHLAVVHEHEQDRPVVPVLPPDAPRLRRCGR